MCVPLSLSPQDSFHWGQTSKREHRANRAFFDESLNRTETGGGPKKKIQWPSSWAPCPHRLNTPITSQLLRITQQLKCVCCPSHQTVPRCTVPQHKESCWDQIGLVKSLDVCAGHIEVVGGCAGAKWRLCGGNLSRLCFAAVHSHECIIYPLRQHQCGPCALLQAHHSGPLSAACCCFIDRRRA